MWKIEYDNDTGPDDGGFWEWWTVYLDADEGDDKSFRCRTKAGAEWLCSHLNGTTKLA